MLNRLPALPSDDLFADDFVSDPLAEAISAARRPMPRPAAVVHRCRRCKRVLRDGKSVARGYGRTCYRRVQEVLAYIGAAFTAVQIVKATDLIDDGGLVVGPDQQCLAVSSDGVRTYVVDVGQATCSCKAGQYGRFCYHLAASVAVTA